MKLVLLLYLLTLSSGELLNVPSYIHGFDKYLQFRHYQENISFFMKYNVTTENRKHFHDLYIQCNIQCTNLPGRKRFNSMVQCVQKGFLQFYDNIKIDQSHQSFVQHLNRLEKFESRSYCKYSWIDPNSSGTSDLKKSERNIFHFQIRQFACEYERFFPSNDESFQSLLKGGGSSFSVIAKGSLLKTCMVYDRFNGLYDVYCNIEQETIKQAQMMMTTSSFPSTTNVCMNITAYLDYEFYHAYQEFAYLVNNHAFIFPLHQLLIENKQYCREITTNNPHSNQEKPLRPSNLQYDGYYSQSYLKGLMMSESSERRIDSHPLQYSYGYWTRRDSSGSMSELERVDRGMIPLLYKTQNTDYVWETPLLEHILNSNKSEVDKALFVPTYIAQTKSNEMMYYHVGASHSRYDFDFSLFRYLMLTNASEDFRKNTRESLQESYERLLTNNTSSSSSSLPSSERPFPQEYYDSLLKNRKVHYFSGLVSLTNRHSDSHWNNFLSYKEILFSSELLRYLNTFCHSFTMTTNEETKESTAKAPSHKVIAFQFGSWDFTFYPVLLLLQFKEEMIRLLKRIINNKHCMRSLTLIYVTPPPFSDVCHDNLDNTIVNTEICQRARGLYRNNYQISVYLHQFINELNEIIQTANSRNNNTNNKKKGEGGEEEEGEEKENNNNQKNNENKEDKGDKENEESGRERVRFFIIDAFHMNLPRAIYYGESVGMNHLLYYESLEFIATPGGWKLLQLIEHAMTFFHNRP